MTQLNFVREHKSSRPSDEELVKMHQQWAENNKEAELDYLEIPLKKGKVLLIDKEDYYKIENASSVVSRGRYAVAIFLTEEGAKMMAIHKLIMNTPEGFVVDRINRNGLDNRKENLRICTSAENSRNRVANKNNRFGYKGVAEAFNGKYVSQIGFEGKTYYGGTLDTIIEAAKSYNEMAIKYHKEFARLNEIPEQPLDTYS
jgi:HNH endonuclease